MTYPKFILTHQGRLRLGEVRMHKDLLRPGEQCYGGGFYEIDYPSNRLLLHGASYDYGRPRWYYPDKILVPASFRGMTIIYQGEYAGEEDINLSAELTIEYI